MVFGTELNVTKTKDKVVRKSKLKVLQNAVDYIKLYCITCAIHCLVYLAKNGLTLLERLFWLILIVGAQYYSADIANTSIERYLTKNTYVGLERDYYFWNTSLPSLTICPMNRIDLNKFDAYAIENKLQEDEKLAVYDFLEHLANSTYINFKDFPNYDALELTLDRLAIKPQYYMELIYNLTSDYTISSYETNRVRCTFDKNSIHVRQVLTEYGICYMTNSYLDLKYTSHYLLWGSYPEKNIYEDPRVTIDVLTGTFFDKEVSYAMMGFTGYTDIYIHSPFEVMKVDNNYGFTGEHIEFDPMTTEILTSDEFDNATIAQRHCRFPHESNLTHFPIYTKLLCIQECRLNLIYSICKCIPHFYPNRSKYSTQILIFRVIIRQPKEVCDYKTLRDCVGPQSEYFLKLYRYEESNGEIIETTLPCYCDQNCVDSILNVQSMQEISMYMIFVGSIGGQISMKTWPRSRLKHIVIFSFSDLLVYIGSAAGFFTGFTVLGAFELLYFFTLRLIYHLIGYKL